MREILFRGKRTDTGQWVYGDLIHVIAGKVGIQYMDGPFLRLSEVQPETVGQFTGMLDTNGVKIFEGDIARYQSDEIVYAAWDEVECDFYWKIPKGFPGYTPQEFLEGYMFTGGAEDVIGNIHDNPELLEEDEDDG